ncbi:MAG: ABC transporter permease [Acidithiobacillales bacterium]
MTGRTAVRAARAASGLVVIALLALLAPLVARSRPWVENSRGETGVAAPVPWDPDAIDLDHRLRPPSASHWLGTDELGRDVLSRLLHGGRISVGAGLLACAIALLAGSLLGALAGLAGGRTDRLVLFVIEVVQSVPALVLVAALAAFLPPSFFLAALLIGLTGWTDSARIVRAESRRLRGAPFVEAARAAGAAPARLLFRHLLPHALPPALVTAPYVLGAAVLTEAGLSFLGLGTPPPAASWGRSLADARDVLTVAPWCVVPPAVALVLLVLSARRLGDALAERSRIRPA